MNRKNFKKLSKYNNIMVQNIIQKEQEKIEKQRKNMEKEYITDIFLITFLSATSAGAFFINIDPKDNIEILTNFMQGFSLISGALAGLKAFNVATGKHKGIINKKIQKNISYQESKTKINNVIYNAMLGFPPFDQKKEIYNTMKIRKAKI